MGVNPVVESAVGRVLVVDDEKALAQIVASYLERAGHDVSTAHSGPEALEAARAQDPDVVVLDLGLPQMDGLTVLKRWRRAGRTAPIDEIATEIQGMGADVIIDYKNEKYVDAIMRETGGCGVDVVLDATAVDLDVPDRPPVLGLPLNLGDPAAAGRADRDRLGLGHADRPGRVLMDLVADELVHDDGHAQHLGCSGFAGVGIVLVGTAV